MTNVVLTSSGSTRKAPRIPDQHPILYTLLRALLRPLSRALFRTRAEGLDCLPRNSAYVVAANHVSMLDWAHILYFFPRCVRFVVHREMLDQLPIRFGCWVNGSIPIRTDRPDFQGLRAARTVLRRGEPLVIFPEGEISLTGMVQSAAPGVIALAMSAKVPIVPAAIRGAFETFPRWRRLPRTGRVTVVFGRPIAPPRGTSRATRRRAAEDLMRRIENLLQTPERHPR